MIFGVAIGEILIRYWFVSAHVLAWFGGYFNYFMMSRSVKFEVPGTVKRSISVALTIFYPFAVCGILKRLGVLAVEPSTAAYFKILPVTAVILGITGYFLNPLILSGFKKMKMPVLGSAITLLAVLFSFTLLGAQRLKAYKVANFAVERATRLCEEDPIVNKSECVARDRNLASVLTSDASCMKSLFRSEQISCLEKRGRIHKAITSCKRIEALGRDKKTQFVEDRTTTMLTAMNTISRTSLELATGSCYFHVADRLESQGFCEASFKDQNLGKLVSGRCFASEYFQPAIGKEKLSQAMWFLSITKAGATKHAAYLPSWREVLAANPSREVQDESGGRLADYIATSESCDEDCQKAFSKYAGIVTTSK